MSASRNLRDYLHRYLPSWLADGYPDSPSFGFRLVWTLGLMADVALEVILQGSLAAVGKMTPTALPYIGQARGLVRNQEETDEEYATRLATWVDRAKENGSSYRLPLAIHDYLSSHPRVRVFRRPRLDGDLLVVAPGYCTTIETDRSIETVEESDFDWDSISHPERATYWSDLFIVVYTRAEVGDPIAQWAQRSGTLDDLTGDDGFSIGHLCTPKEVDDLKGLVLLCKSAHTCIRAVIWTSDPELFVPGDPDSMPNGKWGDWGFYDDGAYVASDRNLTTCRYWEPR